MGKRRQKPSAASSTTTTYKVSIFALLGVIFASGFFIYDTVDTYMTQLAAPIAMRIDPNVGVRTYVTEFFTNNGAEEMLPIIDCESNFMHYEKNGDVLRNRAGSSAIGVAQIMSSMHPDPKALAKYNKAHNTDLTTDDFDVTTLEGNVGYALVLYEIRGTRDWECAKMVASN